MDFPALRHIIAQRWQDDLLPALQDYIAIPCQSPAFDPDWQAEGHMNRAVALMRDWARGRLADVPGASVEVLTLPGRTPVLLVDVPGEGAPVLVYGHLDKQPPMDGWSHGRDAWTPSLEGERLYGRGGADDGYALFATVLAVQALREQGLAHPRCIALIEACEESGSYDLPHYIDHLAPRIGAPAAVVALDAGCGSYDRLWLTTSLRGQVAGTLRVRVLEEGVHSGDASGVVASPLRIVRQLLARLEDADSGEIAEAFQVAIPQARRTQARDAAPALDGGLHAQLPLADGLRPVREDPADEILNRAWRAQLAVTGLDGLPAVADAAAVMVPALALKLSLRLPPTLDAEVAAARLQTLLQADPPYGAQVEFQVDMVSQGWHAPASAPWLAQSLSAASQASFGEPEAWIGGGGGIPFLAMLGQRYPQAQFVVTGVLGPQSNAHGPNEFLHLPTARRITEVLARLLHDAGRAHA
ncbi:M20/M25/M40 family metallo-hydrolase [Lysobacter silvisoli]|uniref:M20/M25/M40 family metallo-hydrolase n=1 Tax=Lysobacter silvisoli TaxID=2293254 RepID=A0A371K2P3_9GAMM|nr:M20/M25/M40 family metallo-hydrolase [Lysobacter silvisoli]RDZ28186.1 M20/M25/M40 family metallo-hydrolase [Lysobacter silvisoli]